MLSVDHVVARRQKGTLRLRPLTDDESARAAVLAEGLVAAARAHVGGSREGLVAAFQDLGDEGLDRRIAAGLQKLVLDACELAQTDTTSAPTYRRELFEAAHAARIGLAEGERFDRSVVVARVAEKLAVAVPTLDEGLFADLRDADTVVSAPSASGASFAAAFPREMERAALLRATRATCTVTSRDAGVVRAFFRTLKFHRLLFEVEATGEGAFVVTVSGPFSLFESVTKYGLGFAMLLDALDMVERYEIVAEVVWGKERTPLELTLSGGTGAASIAEETTRVSDDVEKLRAALVPLCKDAGASVAPCAELVSLPGAGLVVPDLVVKRGKKKVFVELLGFWSRDAVWKRVELVERGLGERIVFCASERLRVREEILESDAAALYVWKGVPQARKVMDRVLRLLDR